MSTRGFAITELIIVLVVLGILLAIGTLNFNGWLKRYQTEAQTREMHSDISNFRLSAMQQKKRSVVILGGSQYIFKTYSSAGEPITAGVQVFSKPTKYEVRKLVGASYNVLDPTGATPDRIEFDERGLTNNIITLVMLPVQLNAGDGCLLVHTARTNIGRMTDASTCTAR